MTLEVLGLGMMLKSFNSMLLKQSQSFIWFNPGSIIYKDVGIITQKKPKQGQYVGYQVHVPSF